MSEPMKGAADPAAEEFKTKTLAELAAIKTRVKWLLLPAFITIAAVLALSVFTVIKVSEIQMQLADTDRVLRDSVRNTQPKRGAEQQGKLVFLQNGLSEAERNEFYHLEEGSEVFPLDWLRALKRKETGNLFLDDVVSMGFVLDPGNPDGLPVGLTAAHSRGLEPLGKMVGLNCAACHVGEMTYKGTRLRIDGAPNMLDTRTFFASLIESSFATLEDSKELIAFIRRVKANRGSRPDDAAPKAEVRSLAGKLLHSLEDKTETVLIDTLGKAIKKIIDDEKNDKTLFDLVGTMKGGVKDAKQFRKKVLEKFDDSRVKGLLDSLPLKKRVDELVSDANHEGTFLYTLQEVYIGVRLLKARAVYLKKLGLVGTDPRTVWGPGRVDAFGSARAFLFEENYKPVNPVSYPFIWGLYRIDWFHYDNNTTSILQRNFGQASASAPFMIRRPRPRRCIRATFIVSRRWPPRSSRRSGPKTSSERSTATPSSEARRITPSSAPTATSSTPRVISRTSFSTSTRSAPTRDAQNVRRNAPRRHAVRRHVVRGCHRQGDGRDRQEIGTRTTT